MTKKLKICLEKKTSARDPDLKTVNWHSTYNPLPDDVQILLEEDVLEFLKDEIEGYIDNFLEICEGARYTKKEIDGLYKLSNKLQKAIQKLLKEIKK